MLCFFGVCEVWMLRVAEKKTGVHPLKHIHEKKGFLHSPQPQNLRKLEHHYRITSGRFHTYTFIYFLTHPHPSTVFFCFTTPPQIAQMHTFIPAHGVVARSQGDWNGIHWWFAHHQPCVTVCWLPCRLGGRWWVGFFGERSPGKSEEWLGRMGKMEMMPHTFSYFFLTVFFETGFYHVQWPLGRNMLGTCCNYLHSRCRQLVVFFSLYMFRSLRWWNGLWFFLSWSTVDRSFQITHEMEGPFLTNRNFMRWAPIFSYFKMYHGPKYHCTIHTTSYVFESTYIYIYISYIFIIHRYVITNVYRYGIHDVHIRHVNIYIIMIHVSIWYSFDYMLHSI